MNNGRKIIGYNTQTGEPIYENNMSNVPGNNYSNNNKSNVPGNNYSNNMSNVSSNNYSNNNKSNVPGNNKYNNQKDNIYKRNNKSKILIFSILISLIIVGLIILFVLLFTGKNTSKENKNLSRTFMIYMVGSNLETDGGMATVDLDAINYNLMDNKNINVVLIAGGSKEWQNNYIDVNETSIYELTANGFTKVKSQDIQNMGSQEVFSNFLNYVYDNYKTDKYNLILWNHGGALLGSEFDELNNNDFLSLEEMKYALKNSPFNSNNKIETVMFSTCLNGTIEVADVFSEYADYLVASEETTISTKLDGDFKFINQVNTNDSGYDVSYKYVQAYKDKVANYKNIVSIYGQSTDLYSTYSIVDLSNIKKLEKDVNDFFNDINLSNDYNIISRVRSNLFQYAYTQTNQQEQAVYDTVDLYSLIEGLKDLSPNKANDVLKTFNKTVLYNWATDSSSHGLSIYFPYNGTNDFKKYFLNIYKDFTYLDNYNKFINDFYNIQSSSTLSYKYNTSNVELIATNDEASDFTLDLTDEQLDGFAKAGYVVFRDRKDGYYVPIYSSWDVKLNGNKLSANIKGKQLKVKSTEDGSEGFVIANEIANNDDYIKYSTVVTLENINDWIFNAANMTLVYNKNTGKVDIESIILKSKETGIPNTVAVNLDDYSHIVFASSSYKILDENGNYDENWESNGIIEGFEEKVDNFDFVLNSFDDDYDYYCVFKIWDVNNNYYYSPLVKMN